VELGKFAEEGDGKARRRLNDFHAWAGCGEGGGKPGLGVGVTVDEEDSGGLNFFGDPAKEVFAGGVSGEIEVADFATNGQGAALFSPVDGTALSRFAQEPSGGRGFGITDKEDGVVFSRKKESCDGVASGFRSHHPCAEEVDVTGAEPKAG